MNKLIQLRDAMGAEAFSDYLLTSDGIAYAVTLLAGIDDNNLSGTLGDVVDESQLDNVESSIDNTTQTEGLFPKPMVTYPTNQQRIGHGRNKTLKFKGGYFTNDTIVKCEGLEVLSYRIYYSRYMYVYVKGGATKGIYPLTITNSGGDTILTDFIKIT